MTTALYEIETSQTDDSTTVPTEGIWTPTAEDAADHGFIAYRGLYVTGIAAPNDDDLYPDRFVVLGHQRWTDIIEAAAAYMDRIHSWRNLHLYPGDDPTELIPRIPRAVHTHGVFLRHPHPDHPCGCEWEDTWRLVWVPSTEPGAVPITVMRHPAATAAGLPDLDHGAPATWAP
ncbi:hypothetical protein [Streptomyces bobili]|uniref:hypothetical protein n=1 Tax=Streptomyces bobili TaxID=67280 RepID=UPI00371AE7E8